MQYEGNIIRPPSEANSIIFQVTAGCSHNKCTFCGAYKDKPFNIRLETFASDLEFAARHCTRQSRVFLADGDALILPYSQLEYILESIRTSLPWVKRVSLYANCKAIRSKNEDQLRNLQRLGLDRIYLGLESGHDTILQKIQKGESAQSMIEAAQKINTSGLFLSVTILLGIAGDELSYEHARATGEVLSQMKPRQISALTFIPVPGTKLYTQVENGNFILPQTKAILEELRTIIEFISLDRVQFYANHASNFLHLSGRLQKDKEKFITTINQGLAGSIALVDDEWRML